MVMSLVLAPLQRFVYMKAYVKKISWSKEKCVKMCVPLHVLVIVLLVISHLFPDEASTRNSLGLLCGGKLRSNLLAHSFLWFLMLLSMLASVALSFGALYHLKANRKKVSPAVQAQGKLKVAKQHMGIVVTLLVQTLCPIVLASPLLLFYLVMLVRPIDDIYSDPIANFVTFFSAFSFHFNPFIDAAAALYFVPPFRKALLYLVRGSKAQKPKRKPEVAPKIYLRKVDAENCVENALEANSRPIPGQT